MKTVSMLELRQIIREVRRGQAMVLTYRGKPVLRLEPLVAEEVPPDDPFFALAGHADDSGEPLSNREMDETIYGR